MEEELPENPVIFLKPSTSLVREGEDIFLPDLPGSVHHEVELVLLIGKTGRSIPLVDAWEYIQGIGVGLDLTARDVQKELKKKGLPWTLAKGFDYSAPVSDFISYSGALKIQDQEVWLKVNGMVRQKEKINKMIFSPPELLNYISQTMTLETGDLVFTGTPDGVGEITSGDTIQFGLGEVLSATFRVAGRF
jgi:2-keto-4-pentenoate hydratase/2-oxohepta-3-ene-1,7-dioic acid hydratase in catechol pathway